jgi:hypothetical protein
MRRVGAVPKTRGGSAPLPQLSNKTQGSNLTQLDFQFYDFSTIYYDISKLLHGVICPVLESLGGKTFILGWG